LNKQPPAFSTFFPANLSFSAGKTALDFGLKILKKILSVSV
jgi:hypothetical protein